MIRYYINGKEVTKEEFGVKGNDDWLAVPPMTASTYRAHDPLLSDGIGCMKSQVKEMRRAIKHRNIQGVTVKDNGQLEITSRRGRKEVLAMRGLVDNDGSYGD